VAVHGGSTTVARQCSGGEGAKEEKGLFIGAGGGGAPFIAGGGGGTGAAQRRDCGRRGGGGEAVCTTKWWRPRLGCHQRGLGADVRTMRLTGWSHPVSIFFNLSKTSSNLNFKMGALT
jgi:hypothetical protein